MTKLTKIVLFLILVLAFSNIVYAENETVEELEPFEVEIVPIKDRIDFQENAEYKVIITNPRSSIERFTIKPAAPYVEWFIKTDPVSDYSTKAYPNSEQEVKLIVKPLSVGIGRYALRINVKHVASDETFKKDIIVNVASMSNVPAVSISGKMPDEIDPRETFIVTAWLENRNAKNLEEVTVELKSDAIHESTTTSLGPLNSGQDKKTLEFSVKLDEKTAPIKDNLRIVVTAKEDGEVYEMKSAPFEYEIINYGGLVDVHDKKGFLIWSKDKVSFVNDANRKYEGVAKLENPFYRALFTKATPKPTSFVEDGKRYIGWDVELKSKETFDVIVKVNYIPLVIVLLILGGLIFSYFKYRSDIVITKSVQDVSVSEGGIRKFKVMLHIKNRSKRGIENIAIIDRIPDIADFDKEAEVGTLSPVKVVHSKRGVIAKWVIDSLGQDEETVIKYGAKSRLSILGKMPLPTAIAKFADEKGATKRGYSNTTNIGS